MLSAFEIKIYECVLHKVGNKLRGEEINLSNSYLDGINHIRETLIDYFLTPEFVAYLMQDTFIYFNFKC